MCFILHEIYLPADLNYVNLAGNKNFTNLKHNEITKLMWRKLCMWIIASCGFI